MSIAERHGVTGIRVFGSFARGEARPDSDLDLLIDAGPVRTPFFPGGLIADLQAELGRRIDVTTRSALHPGLREEVLREAEVWSFLWKKEKRVRREDDQNLGDCYTFVAIERNTKLVLNIAMGKRDQITTNSFIEGLRDAINPGTSFQITTDGFAPYKTSIPDTFGDYVDYAMLIKVYAAVADGERKYSPAEVKSVEVVPVCGNPDPDRICTSIIERSNLSLRMGQRRWTRLTNAFGRKWENQWAAVALWYTYYNFCRIHQSLRVTPAMQAGIADHQWSIAELLA